MALEHMDHTARASLIERLQNLVAKEHAPWFRWVFALTLFAVAFTLRLELDSTLPAGFPYLTFFPAVIVATLVSGLWPGVVSAVLGGLASWYFFIAPTYSFGLTPGALLALAFYTFIVTVDILIIHTITIVTRSLRAQRQELADLAASKVQENQQLLEQDAFQRQVSAELAHRLKNQLALVQAIINQTTRTANDPATLGATLRGRIGVLAEAHDLLVHGGTGMTSVEDIVRKAISIYDTRRFTIGGPEVQIADRPAVSLALMLHELGTNAAKYGALSGPAGQVDIRWDVSGGPERQFVLSWTERDGPAVVKPEKKGAGSRLIVSGVGSGSDVRHEFDEDGVLCRLSVAVDQLKH
jgi:two-component sensor histidine kinase